MTRVGTSEAKAVNHTITDAHMRKDRQQNGLGTRVVYPVNDEYQSWGFLTSTDKLTQSIPPGDYGRKIKTQKNRRGAIKVEEYAV